MAQLIESWLVCGGRYRIHGIGGLGRRKGRIVEVEVIGTGELIHGSARWLEKLARELAGPASTAWEQTPKSLVELLTAKGRRP